MGRVEGDVGEVGDRAEEVVVAIMPGDRTGEPVVVVVRC